MKLLLLIAVTACSPLFADQFSLLGTAPVKELTGQEVSTNGTLVLTFKTSQFCGHAVYSSCGPHVRIWKEVYAASNGVVVLKETIEAHYQPQQTIAAQINWPK